VASRQWVWVRVRVRAGGQSLACTPLKGGGKCLLEKVGGK